MGCFRCFIVCIDKRGVHGDQGSVPALRCRDLPQHPAGLLWEATLGFPPNPDSKVGSEQRPPAFPTATAVQTHLPLTSPGLLCGSKHLKFAQLIQ